MIGIGLGHKLRSSWLAPSLPRQIPDSDVHSLQADRESIVDYVTESEDILSDY